MGQELKDKKEIWDLCVEGNPHNLEEITSRWYDNSKYALNLIRKKPYYIKYISENLRTPTFFADAMYVNPDVEEYINNPNWLYYGITEEAYAILAKRMLKDKNKEKVEYVQENEEL